MSTVLKFINVNKNFVQAGHIVEVLKEINLDIKAGELIALTGQSGSGKTTLLQLAGLLDSPTNGEILINNNHVFNHNEKIDDKKNTELRKKNIGFVYQFHHLLPEFSAIENVAMPLLIQNINPKQAFIQATEILKEVELQNYLNSKPDSLSGGQQQRVAIARAIVGKPKLILADEPTGNLDNELAKKVFDILRHLTDKYQIACLIATHNLELAQKTHRRINLKSGRIIEEN